MPDTTVIAINDALQLLSLIKDIPDPVATKHQDMIKLLLTQAEEHVYKARVPDHPAFVETKTEKPAQPSPESKHLELFEGTLHDAALDLERCHSALSCIYVQYQNLNEISDKGTAHLINLIDEDIASIQDHIKRALRASENWEKVHRELYGGGAA